MEIATGSSTLQDPEKAVNAAWKRIINSLDHKPSLLICSASANYAAQTLSTQLTELAPKGCKIAGASSCLGTMSNTGYHSQNGYGLSITAFSDRDSDFGIGLIDQSDSAEKAAAQAIQAAIHDANRPGELPDLVWLSAAPGQEEAILTGIASVIGQHVPVIGGSSADNTINAQWWQFRSQQVKTDGILLIAMYLQCQFGLSFHNGYVPTTCCGTVTAAKDRVIYEINHQPAAQVYNDWTQGLIDNQLGGGNILQLSTFQPLGREIGRIEDVPYYALLHPEQVLEGSAMHLFSRVHNGEVLTLMSGSADSLSSRASSVARGILERKGWQSQQLAGAMVVYCAGCMLGIHSRMPEVTAGLREALGSIPFHGRFTFGEQGRFINGQNCHGNLMISVVIFTKN